MLLIFSGLCFNSSAQKKTLSENQDLLWTRYSISLPITAKISWTNEVDNRLFMSSWNRFQTIGHSLLHFNPEPSLTVSGGITFSNANPPEPFSENPTSRSEMRFNQLLTFTQKEKKLDLSHRIRFEERFFMSNPVSEGTFNWRFRYMFTVSKPLNENLTLKLSDEVFINAGKNIVFNTFDANRLYAALNYKICAPLGVELGYLRSVQQLSDGLTYLKRDNIRFTLYHNLKTK
ncbi:DUF2490 domain-containing protein [Jiulongibacter sp. NS-SX5]|uniref:DUF2490 domain-containing protein n=1 Tax=Jiulongibacter sp. NS-SX5 TaxID=3463854 RepID=UPI00405A3EC6